MGWKKLEGGFAGGWGGTLPGFHLGKMGLGVKLELNGEEEEEEIHVIPNLKSAKGSQGQQGAPEKVAS